MAKNTNGKKIHVLIYIISIVFAAGGLVMAIRYNTEKISTNVESIKDVKKKADEACNEVIGLKKDVYYIREKVDNNAKVQQQILQEIKELKR